jgi:hypothetical protein
LGGVHEPFGVIVEGHNPTRQLCRRQFIRQQFSQPVEMLSWVSRVARRVVLRLPGPSIIRVRCKSMHSNDAEIIVRNLRPSERKDVLNSCIAVVMQNLYGIFSGWRGVCEARWASSPSREADGYDEKHTADRENIPNRPTRPDENPGNGPRERKRRHRGSRSLATAYRPRQAGSTRQTENGRVDIATIPANGV